MREGQLDTLADDSLVLDDRWADEIGRQVENRIRAELGG